METVKLKNGTEEAKVAVSAIMLSIKSLSPIDVYELAMKCRDRKHQIWEPSRKPLQDLKLVAADGSSIHETIRNIVLSAIEGEGFDMTIGSPVADSG
jgi:hypothetical protein